MENIAEQSDSIWDSAQSAKHIQRLGQVEQDIVRLMELASECMSLLALPQTDSPDKPLPVGPPRSQAFATNAEQYFQTLDAIQVGIRTSIARVRSARIPPGALRAPDARMVTPRALGTGIPSTNSSSGESKETQRAGVGPDPDAMAVDESLGETKTAAAAKSSSLSGESGIGFQERKVEADAWAGLALALRQVVANSGGDPATAATNTVMRGEKTADEHLHAPDPSSSASPSTSSSTSSATT